MKRAIVYLCALCALCALCGQIQAANEIRAFCPGATACFSVVREIDGDVWYVVGQVFEAWGTGARTAADYDIALVDKSGDMFVGTMDTNIGAGYYHILTHQQAGANPADTDPAIWQEYGYWSGTVWQPYTLKTIEDLITDVNANIEGYIGDVPTTEEIRIEMDSNSVDFNTIIADTNELQTDWADGGRLDLLIDAIKAMTDLIAIHTTAVSASDDAGSFTVAAGITVADAINFHIIAVQDADDSHWELRWIEDWTAARIVTVETSFGFTPAIGDAVHVMGTGYGGWLKYIRDHLVRDTSVFDFRSSAGGGGTPTLNAEDEDP